MVSQEILEYVKKELEKGVSESKLRQVLMEYGWPEFEINEAFEKAKESKPVEKPEEKKEIIEEKPEEAKPEEKKIEKPPIIEYVKKVITNKIFIVSFAVLFLGLIIFFILSSLFEGGGGSESGAMEYAENLCRQYCNSDQCGLFIDNTLFTHPELKGKSCIDLGFECLQPNGQPKCETEY